jgi:hypothetical protein
LPDRDGLDGAAVEEDRSRRRLEGVRDERQQRRLAAARAADDPHRLAVADAQIDVAQDETRVVGEGQIADFEVPLRHHLHVLRDVGRRRDTPDFVQPGHGGHAALEEIDHPAQSDQRPDHPPEVELEGHEGAEGHRPGQDLPAAEEEDEDEHQPDERMQGGIERGGQADQRAVALHVLVVHPLEGDHLALFTRERAHHPHAGQVLLHARGDLAEVVLHGAGARMDAPPEDRHHSRHDRHGHERQQRHRRLGAQHHHERAGHDQQ